MEKKSLIALTILLLLPTMLSVEFDMKTEFSQGETLIARISGNFLEPILKQNIFFYRGHVRVPMEYNVGKINDEFYIYALLDKPENNYSIAIQNIQYMVGKDVSEEDITKEFFINNNTADFSINPGFIITDNDFLVEVQNLQNEKIDITISDGYESVVTLKSGEIQKLNFKLSEINESMLSSLELSSENLKYEIPVYAFSIKETSESKKRDFKLEPSELEILMPTESETKRIIYLYNTGDATLENISIFVSNSLEPYLSFSIEEFIDLEPDSNVKIELFFKSPLEEDTIEGRITVKQDNLYTYADINLEFIKDYIPLNEEEEEIIRTAETCAEMQGIVCEDSYECSEDLVYAKDDVCCLGTCEEIKKSNTGKIIGWSMVALAVIFVIWFFKTKYRGAKKPINLLKIGKRK